MPENWVKYKVENLIKERVLIIGDGYRAKNSELSNNGLPFARAGNINQGFLFDNAECLDNSNLSKAKEKISQTGDVVFTSKGTVGRFAFVKENTPKFVYSPQLCYWRTLNREVIDPRFLYFWMHGQEFFRQSSGVKGLTDMADYVSLVNQRRFEITLPPIEEQRRIAEMLSALDEKIELNLQMNATLEKIAQTTFKQWFVEFQFPGFDGELINGLPKDWRKAKINNLAKSIQYGFTQSSSNNPTGYKFLRITDIQGGTVSWNQVPYCVASESEFKKYKIVDHDIFIARTGASTGENIYITDAPDAVFASYLIRVQFDNPHLALYVGKFLRRIEYFGYVASILGGSAQPNANAQELTNVEITLPPDYILEKYFGMVSEMNKRKIVNEQQKQALTQIRNNLLPKLMSGKIRL